MEVGSWPNGYIGLFLGPYAIALELDVWPCQVRYPGVAAVISRLQCDRSVLKSCYENYPLTVGPINSSLGHGHLAHGIVCQPTLHRDCCFTAWARFRHHFD